jgi:hypothetical protein
MAEQSERRPRFNHVAMSVPAEALDEAGRRAILDFYGEVFGFTEMPGLTVDRERLVLRAHSNEQFVFVHADPEPMQCPKMDHYGMSVGSKAAFADLYDRARKYRERDPAVEIVEARTEDYKVLQLHNFYVRYRLPMMIEVQCYEWAPGVGEDSLPES